MSKAEVIYGKVKALPDTAQTAVLRMVELLGDNMAAAAGSGSGSSAGAALKFQELADTWHRETGFLSFMQQRALHPAYQRIIGMGWAAVPFLLRELERQPDHWLWALQSITGEEPARGTKSLSAAAEAWLNWGRNLGLLTDAQG
jgi:hypothetical protein